MSDVRDSRSRGDPVAGGLDRRLPSDHDPNLATRPGDGCPLGIVDDSCRGLDPGLRPSPGQDDACGRCPGPRGGGVGREEHSQARRHPGPGPPRSSVRLVFPARRGRADQPGGIDRGPARAAHDRAAHLGVSGRRRQARLPHSDPLARALGPAFWHHIYADCPARTVRLPTVWAARLPSIALPPPSPS